MTNMDNKIILCFMGMSGVGKDTVVKKFLKRNTEFTMMTPISTRPMRDGEKNGDEYIFVDDKTFQSMIDNGEIMEHRKYKVTTSDNRTDVWYYGNKYPENTYSVMIGTPESYENIMKTGLPDNIKVYPIYLSITDNERLYRLINRENRMTKPNFREMIRRFYQDQVDFSEERLEESGILSDSYDNVFIQLNSNSTVVAVEDYVKNKILNESNKEDETENEDM